ncbi:MAG: phosphotransferase [Chitinispirillales bacterium]|jgi:aminoglycoside/choline kinase family phosphotransferase|nr:phosphotransferase [Chitinispirillales bacterium]
MELRGTGLTGVGLEGTEFSEVELTEAELTPAQIAFLETSIKNFDVAEWKTELAGQAASTRRFFRVSNANNSCILVEWDSGDEDWPRFLGIEARLSSSVPFLPRIYASDPLHGLILEEDLGGVTLKRFCLDHAGQSVIIEDAYRKVINALAVWHSQDVANCPFIASRSMDAETFLWETSYFARHCVVEFFAKEELLTAEWENERRKMAEYAAAIPAVCIHRDFQSENVLITDGRVRFVDYQGARLGPPHYDAASLIFDPYVDLGYGMIDGLIDCYLTKTGAALPQCQEQGEPVCSPPQNQSLASESDAFYICAAQRLMQALGAYANLSLHKGKPRYREFIPAALERLYYVMDYLPDYPAIKGVVHGCQ